MKAYLRIDETGGCVATSPSGKYSVSVIHGVGYDFMYNDDGGFFLIVDDRIYEETSTAFDFKNE